MIIVLDSISIIYLLIAHFLSICAIVHVLLTKRNPRSALGWVVVLLFLPVAGFVTYLIFGISRAQSRAEEIMRQYAHIDSYFQAHDAIFKQAVMKTTQQEFLAKLGHELTNEPLCIQNKIIPLFNGDEAYPQMLSAIRNAKEHIFLGSYIFNDGISGQAFINELKKAYARNVDVRVIVDGIGALYSHKKPWNILKDAGIPVTLFRPISLLPPRLGINLRCHRKILICDNLGFTGGMNISDGNLLHPEIFYKNIYSNLPVKERPNYSAIKKNVSFIQDIHFCCRGAIVNQLRKAFLLNWSFCNNCKAILPPIQTEPEGNSLCRVIIDGPGNDLDIINDLICGAINLAQSEVRIMTPYFLPTSDLMGSIRSAAQRGVNVNIILPLKNNLAYMTWATMRILPELLNANVHIWHQPPPFAHTKLLTIDDFYTLAGSANLDARSLRLNFELNIEIYDTELTRQLNNFMDSIIQKGTAVTLNELHSLSLLQKLRNSACWIFSPYL